MSGLGGVKTWSRFVKCSGTAGDVRTGAALLALAGMVFGGVALGRGQSPISCSACRSASSACCLRLDSMQIRKIIPMEKQIAANSAVPMASMAFPLRHVSFSVYNSSNATK